MRFWKGKNVPADTKLSMVVASYLSDDPRRTDSLLCLLHSFRAQTWTNWEAIVVHDGPWPPVARFGSRRVGTQLVADFQSAFGDDGRIRFYDTRTRRGHFGHPNRDDGIALTTGQWVGLTNDDNYYAPVYFEWMLHAGVHAQAKFVYCDMVHSHQHWKPFTTEPRYKKLDLGGWIARASLVKAHPFDKHTFNGDGDYINRLVKAAGARVVKVPATLFVHN